MNDLESVHCKFTVQIERRQDRYVVEIPEREIELGTLSEDEVYQLSIHQAEPKAAPSSSPGSQQASPPVSEGERRTVDIEDRGDQGDGIARVSRGYVLIVPDTNPGDTVTVEINQVNQQYGFAEVIDYMDEQASRAEHATK